MMADDRAWVEAATKAGWLCHVEEPEAARALRAEVAALTAERDAARAEVERLTNEYETNDMWSRKAYALANQRCEDALTWARLWKRAATVNRMTLRSGWHVPNTWHKMRYTLDFLAAWRLTGKRKRTLRRALGLDDAE